MILTGLNVVQLAKAVTRIFFGGCHIGAKIDGAEWVRFGEGCPHPQQIFAFLFQNGEFLCMPAWISAN